MQIIEGLVVLAAIGLGVAVVLLGRTSRSKVWLRVAVYTEARAHALMEMDKQERKLLEEKGLLNVQQAG